MNSTVTTLANLEKAVELRKSIDELTAQVAPLTDLQAKLNAATAELNALLGVSTGKVKSARKPLSPEARAAIAAGQQRRHAAAKAAKAAAATPAPVAAV